MRARCWRSSGWRCSEGAALAGGAEAEHAGRERKDGVEEFEDAVDGDADDFEGQQEQPDDWIEHEGEQGQRPTDDEENAPHEEFEHSNSLSSE